MVQRRCIQVDKGPTFVKALANGYWGGSKNQAAGKSQSDVDAVRARRLKDARQTNLATFTRGGRVLAQNIVDLPTGGVSHDCTGHWGNTEEGMMRNDVYNMSECNTSNVFGVLLNARAAGLLGFIVD